MTYEEEQTQKNINSFLYLQSELNKILVMLKEKEGNK